MRVKIISGYSGHGGSTTAFIMLTNELNKNGIDATFYGPQQYHLDKCKSGVLDNMVLFDLQTDDVLVFHFLGLSIKPPAKKVIFVSHETYWGKVNDAKVFFDVAVFLHEEHREYHKGYTGKYEIIPNLKPNLLPKQKDELDLVAGVIGGIETRKQTHRSIQRALDDGCTKIYLFGNINDNEYYATKVYPLIQDNPNVIEFAGYSENKQSIYDQIGRVYHSSKGEVACLVKDECALTNTKFFGNGQTQNEVSTLTNEEVVAKWIKLFEA